ncbi:MAG: hypothetical protein ACPG31_06790 [Planctomycetota bacterium]
MGTPKTLFSASCTLAAFLLFLPACSLCCADSAACCAEEEVEIAWDAVPAHVQKAALFYAEGREIEEITFDMEDGQEVYEIELDGPHGEVDLLLGTDGRLIAIETDDDDDDDDRD